MTLQQPRRLRVSRCLTIPLLALYGLTLGGATRASSGFNERGGSCTLVIDSSEGAIPCKASHVAEQADGFHRSDAIHRLDDLFGHRECSPCGQKVVNQHDASGNITTKSWVDLERREQMPILHRDHLEGKAISRLQPELKLLRSSTLISPLSSALRIMSKASILVDFTKTSWANPALSTEAHRDATMRLKL